MSGDSADFPTRPADWLAVDEAVRRVLAHAHPGPSERVAPLEALGRALAAPVVARATLPPWDNSAMDGYAVRGVDVAGATAASPVRLRVVAVARAGADAGAIVGDGDAVRIMTGAPIPRGADTVVRVEDTDGETEAGTVVVFDDRDRGRHVRPGGQDMRAGDTLLEPGHSIAPGTVGVVAAAGLDSVEVHRRPVVAILPTGDELRGPSRWEDVEAGRGVPETNGSMLAAMVAAAGGVPRLLAIAPDDRDELAARLEAAAPADALITIGGASMGEADLVKRVLDDFGFELGFWRVMMRPGSPVSFGHLPRDAGPQPVFGLPGNPSSAFVTFEVFVRPYLLRAAGHRRVFRRIARCRAGTPISTPADLTFFQRVRVARETGSRPGGLVATLTGPQGSGLVSGLGRADGLAVIPPEVSAVAEGEEIDVMLLDDAPASEDAWPE